MIVDYTIYAILTEYIDNDHPWAGNPYWPSSTMEWPPGLILPWRKKQTPDPTNQHGIWTSDASPLHMLNHLEAISPCYQVRGEECGSKVGKPDPSSLPVWALTRGQWLTFFAIWESSLAAWQVDPAWNSGCCLMIFDWISQNFLVHIAQVAGTLWALWYRNCEAGRTCGFQAATFSASVRYVAVELWLVRI